MADTRVVGCVWAAWRNLTAEADAADEPGPSYDWCESTWRTIPAGELPPVGDKRLPQALTDRLGMAWREHGQTSLW